MHRRKAKFITQLNILVCVVSLGIIVSTIIHDESFGEALPKYLALICLVTAGTAATSSLLCEAFPRGMTEAEALLVIGIFLGMSAIQNIMMVASGIFLHSIISQSQIPGSLYYFYFYHNRWISNALLYVTSFYAVSVCVLTYISIFDISISVIELIQKSKC
eukprot:Gregarina_sp_Poly_1__5792@NODE_304_length_9736_cov_136_409039_g263_i0_p7_GENE_NODE_304_length_9736_cov_136_409039_g263_i0NODE_304_length_9736_cov_136_409039_g263_i0_p7_ORF_typecomplete_len161_score19_26DUF2644/PF10841_8/1_3DUF2644/PF10841_8/20DUF2644/PF10841_8/1_6e03SLATT_5/PF18160_1/2_5SLATT_5/PF18160_1/55SLATT_5/PF18160_1/74SLATT_4/PF18186_1/0_25SLATT_4/PF18186_1/1_1e03Peptidase_A24/PF01478_18/1_8Peptidase_A24/PF01478_18/4_6e02_NODE_304_length_9736_cov_136_409039_g263_i075828064